MNKTSAESISVLSNLYEVFPTASEYNLGKSLEKFNNEVVTIPPDNQPDSTPIPTISTTTTLSTTLESTTDVQLQGLGGGFGAAAYVVPILLGIVYILVYLASIKYDGLVEVIFSGIGMLVIIGLNSIINILLLSITLANISKINSEMDKTCVGENGFSTINESEKQTIAGGIACQLIIIIAYLVIYFLRIDSDKAHIILNIGLCISMTIVMIAILLSGGIYIKAERCGLDIEGYGAPYLGTLIFAFMMSSLNYLIFSLSLMRAELIPAILAIPGFAIGIILSTIAYWGSLSDNDQEKVNLTVKGVVPVTMGLITIIPLLISLFKWWDNIDWKTILPISFIAGGIFILMILLGVYI